jgi:hypothetical protein
MGSQCISGKAKPKFEIDAKHFEEKIERDTNCVVKEQKVMRESKSESIKKSKLLKIILISSSF